MYKTNLHPLSLFYLTLSGTNRKNSFKRNITHYFNPYVRIVFQF
ncbi:hypothetical protein LEP1GSC017_2308 [Leptospira meyeri serovar Hardjo str. Went 5]|nr:hypothetical protein LEP1GSC017_2308 [Leptospira meyeri serovar Hardjo str. Went 5]